MTRTHDKVRYSPEGKRASSLRWQGAALLGPGTGGAGDFPENAGPAASPDGDRWDRPARRPPPGSAQGGVLPAELGTALVPGARGLAEMGGAARGNAGTAGGPLEGAGPK